MEASERRSRIACLLIAAICAGCDDDGGQSAADAATDVPDASGEAELEIGDELAVALPQLTPCPPGWSQRVLGGDTAGVVCDPWPTGGVSACGDAEAYFPGDADCSPIGAPCPDGEAWAADLPETGVVYVQPGVAGGDGTRERPFGTLDAALAASPTTVALARGTYELNADLEAGVELRGACAAETALAAAVTDDVALDVLAPGVVLRNLRIGGPAPALRIAGEADVHLEGVAIDGTTALGAIVLPGGALTARDSVFRNLQQGAFATFAGRPELEVTSAVAVFGNGHVAFEGVVIEDCPVGAIFAVHDPSIPGADSAATAEVILTDVAVRGIVAAELHGGPPTSWGLLLGSVGGEMPGPPASAELERVSFESGGLTAVSAFGTARVDLTDVSFRTAASGEPTSGVLLAAGAEADLERVSFDRLTRVAVLSYGDVSLTARDLVIHETQPSGAEGWGGALWLGDGTLAVIERAIIVENTGLAVFLWNAANLAARDVVLSNTLIRPCGQTSCPDLAFGVALSTRDGGTASLERFAAQENALAAFQLTLDGELDLADGLIAGSPIGVNLQLADFDIGRLMQRVAYRDNEIDLDTSRLPIPDVSSVFAP